MFGARPTYSVVLQAYEVPFAYIFCASSYSCYFLNICLQSDVTDGTL